MSTAIGRAKQDVEQFVIWINGDDRDAISEERHYRLALMHAAIAQAEAAERQAAAAERANELADPYKLVEQRDAEIARLNAELQGYAQQPPVIEHMFSDRDGFTVSFEAEATGRLLHLLRRTDGTTCLYMTWPHDSTRITLFDSTGNVDGEADQRRSQDSYLEH